MRRTAIINQIRGLLLERGITLRRGRYHVDAALPSILEDASAKLSGALRVLLAQLKLELDHVQSYLSVQNMHALVAHCHRGFGLDKADPQPQGRWSPLDIAG